MLRQTVEVSAEVQRWYEEFAFHKIYHRINNFCIVELSAFYFDVLKDRLYISARKSRVAPGGANCDLAHRRSAGAVAGADHELYFRRSLAVFAARSQEDWRACIWRSSPRRTTCWARTKLRSPLMPKQSEDWKIVLAVRETVLKALEEARNQKLIGGNLQAQVTLTAVDPVYLGAGTL